MIRTSLPADRFVRAMEFSPGTRRSPCRPASRSDSASRALDGGDGQPGFDGMGATGTQEPDGHFVGWAPGRGPIVSAEGRPWRLARGTDLVLELHLIPSDETGGRAADGGAVLRRRRRAGCARDAEDGIEGHRHSAGATGLRHHRSLRAAGGRDAPEPVSARALPRKGDAGAGAPAGRHDRTLLHIPRWSFHWQQDYRFTTPVALPRGTTVAMRFTYDNSEATTTTRIILRSA